MGSEEKRYRVSFAQNGHLSDQLRQTNPFLLLAFWSLDIDCKSVIRSTSQLLRIKKLTKTDKMEMIPPVRVLYF